MTRGWKASIRRELFAHEYLIDLNGAAAARRSGYAPSRAKETASELLRDPEVRAKIGALIWARDARLENRDEGRK